MSYRTKIIFKFAALLLAIGLPSTCVSLPPAIATAINFKKVPQKPLRVLSTQTKYYFGYDVNLKTIGGSGNGKISFTTYGNCAYVSGKLFTVSRVPVSCSVQATKAGDKKFLPAKSSILKVYFDYLPGYYDTLNLSVYDLWSVVSFNEEPSQSYLNDFNSLSRLSEKSSVRYREYWSKLYSYWDYQVRGLTENLRIIDRQINFCKETRCPADIESFWLKTKQSQNDLLQKAQGYKSLTYSNFLRDIKYFQ